MSPLQTHRARRERAPRDDVSTNTFATNQNTKGRTKYFNIFGEIKQSNYSIETKIDPDVEKQIK